MTRGIKKINDRTSNTINSLHYFINKETNFFLIKMKTVEIFRKIDNDRIKVVEVFLMNISFR